MQINLTFSQQSENQLVFHSERMQGVCAGDIGSGLYIESDGPLYADKILVGIIVTIIPEKHISGFSTCALGPSSELKFIKKISYLRWIVENIFSQS